MASGKRGKFNLSGLFNFGTDIGIDLGTASILIYVKGKGIVLNEPSVVAIDQRTGYLIAIGEEARQMLGRTPGNIVAVRPLREGVVADYDITEKMLRYFIEKACGRNFIFKPRVMVCIPSGVTGVEERAVRQAALQAGARQAFLIEEPLAAALGAGQDIAAPGGHMVIDIGGGTTDIAVLSLGGVVVSESIKVAGEKFDEAIIRYVRRKYKMTIGERTAEMIKIRIGCACKTDEVREMDVKGSNLMRGLPQVVHITSAEMPKALEEPITQVVEAVCGVIEKTPPELIGDIVKNGIVMTGGGSLLYGLDRLLEYVTGVPVRVANHAISCVAMGTGKSLESLGGMNQIFPDRAQKLFGIR